VHWCGQKPPKAMPFLQACARAQANGLTSAASWATARVQSTRRHLNPVSARQQDTEGTLVQLGTASQRQNLPPSYACVHACASRRFDRDGDTSRAAHSTPKGHKGQAGRARGSSAAAPAGIRLDSMVGTQASAVAWWQQRGSTRLKAQHHGQGPISPRLEGRVPQQRGGRRCSPCGSGCGGGRW
jgi:hypothetical protein